MKWPTKLAGAAGALLLLLGALGAWEARDLPDAGQLRQQLRARSFRPSATPWVPLSALSPKLQAAVLVSEDVAFYQHRGFNWAEIGNALWSDVAAGRYQRGASTITQQVAKNLFLGREKTLRRKFREAVLAARLEQALTKEEILEIYLNTAEWGDGIVGAEAAARRYFGKPASELTWAEAALLAGILPNPRRNDPLLDPGSAWRLRHRVLLKLRQLGLLSEEEFRWAEATPCCGADRRAPGPERKQKR